MLSSGRGIYEVQEHIQLPSPFITRNGCTPPLPPAPFSCWKYGIKTFIAQQGEYICSLLPVPLNSFSVQCPKASVMLEANLQGSNNTGIFNKPLTQQSLRQNIGLENCLQKSIYLAKLIFFCINFLPFKIFLFSKFKVLE